MTVDSVYPRLYQINPNPGNRRLHGESFKNLAGSDWNMGQLRDRHDTNSAIVPYLTAGTIVIKHDQDIDTIRSTWDRIARKLRRANVIAWWMREIAMRSNRVHYHLIITSAHKGDNLKELVRASCPNLNFRMQFDPIVNQRQWANYLCKSTDFCGKESYLQKKVILFAPEVNLIKHNTIGDFWQKESELFKPSKEQKKDYREHTHKMLEASRNGTVHYAALLLSRRTGIDSESILTKYCENLILDPTLYQQYSDDARDYSIEYEPEPAPDSHDPLTPYVYTFSRDIVEPFKFSPCPPPPKPPTRTKATMTPKPARMPFSPDNCWSYDHLGNELHRPSWATD